MKKTVKKDNYGKSIEELRALIKKEEDEMVKMKLYRKIKKTKNLREVYIKRKNLAVYKTYLREKELQNG